jgi:hypothetical protein
MRTGVIPTEVCERCADIRVGTETSAPTREGLAPARRAAIAGLAVIGAALVAMPFVFQLFDRAPKGATMVSAFSPYMTRVRLDGYQRELQFINAGVQESNTKVATFLIGSSTNGAHARFDRRFHDFAAFRDQWPGIDSDMTSMMDTIQANRGNYDAVAALPSFRLFPWFFVLPGALILLALALLAVRRGRWRVIRWVFVAVGVGLVVAPLVFQMFARAPKGAQMVDAFRSIETTRKVQTIQGYFGDMAVGQGAIRLDLVPALERAGLSRQQVATRFPAVDALDRQWVHILNDMTPMVGVMSDNVSNYRAVAALPPFGLFPWFFVLPGALTVGLTVAAGAQRRSTAAESTAPSRSSDKALTEGVT